MAKLGQHLGKNIHGISSRAPGSLLSQEKTLKARSSEILCRSTKQELTFSKKKSSETDFRGEENKQRNTFILHIYQNRKCTHPD